MSGLRLVLASSLSHPHRYEPSGRNFARVGTMVRERRYDREHRKDHGFRQGDKEISSDTPLRKNIGTNTMQIAQRRDERGNSDLGSTVEDSLFDLLALFQISIDVFDLDRCVVDENSNRKRQTTQRHDVDCLAQRAEGNDRANSESREESKRQ